MGWYAVVLVALVLLGVVIASVEAKVHIPSLQSNIESDTSSTN